VFLGALPIHLFRDFCCNMCWLVRMHSATDRQTDRRQYHTNSQSSTRRLTKMTKTSAQVKGWILRRFWDMSTYWFKIAYFSYPSLIRRPTPKSKLTMNGVTRLSSSEDREPYDRSLSHFDMIPDCDRQTDRQTGGRTHLLHSASHIMLTRCKNRPPLQNSTNFRYRPYAVLPNILDKHLHE